jgi:hypothetical protein
MFEYLTGDVSLCCYAKSVIQTEVAMGPEIVQAIQIAALSHYLTKEKESGQTGADIISRLIKRFNRSNRAAAVQPVQRRRIARS